MSATGRITRNKRGIDMACILSRRKHQERDRNDDDRRRRQPVQPVTSFRVGGRRRKSSVYLRQTCSELDRRSVLPHRRNDLDANWQAAIGESNRCHGCGQTRKRRSEDPVGGVLDVRSLSLWNLENTPVDRLAVIVWERGGKRGWQEKHVVVLEVLLPERAIRESAQCLAQPACMIEVPAALAAVPGHLRFVPDR